MWLLLVHLAVLVALAAAAESTPASAATTNITSGLPTVSLFLPMADTSQQLAASIITARPNGTVYAIGCLPSVDAADCGFDPPVTITENKDSLRFTMSYEAGDEPNTDSSSPGLGSTSTSSAPLEVTSNCSLYGAPRATSAVCTGNNAVSGLGNAASSTTLASSEINYMPVVITAGAQKTSMAAASGSAAASSTKSLGNAAVAPAVQNLAIGAGLAAVGILI